MDVAGGGQEAMLASPADAEAATRCPLVARPLGTESWERLKMARGGVWRGEHYSRGNRDYNGNFGAQRAMV